LEWVSADVDAFVIRSTFTSWREFVEISQEQQYHREYQARLDYVETLELEVASTENEVRRLATIATDLSSQLETKTWCPIYDVSMNSFDLSIVEPDVEPAPDTPNGMSYEERQVWQKETNLSTARDLLVQFQERIEFLKVQLAASEGEPSYF
jgi:hypothetical protein